LAGTTGPKLVYAARCTDVVHTVMDTHKQKSNMKVCTMQHKWTELNWSISVQISCTARIVRTSCFISANFAKCTLA